MNKRLFALAILTSLVLGSGVVMADKPCRDSASRHSHHEVKASPCPANNCQDARICISVRSRPCFTDQGLQAFAALFATAAERGVENAMVRALNATQVTPPGVPGKGK